MRSNTLRLIFLPSLLLLDWGFFPSCRLCVIVILLIRAFPVLQNVSRNGNLIIRPRNRFPKCLVQWKHPSLWSLVLFKCRMQDTYPDSSQHFLICQISFLVIWNTFSYFGTPAVDFYLLGCLEYVQVKHCGMGRSSLWHEGVSNIPSRFVYFASQQRLEEGGCASTTYHKLVFAFRYV